MFKITDLNDMMLFMFVIDAGSFTKAADNLKISKANLSRKISKLEQQLGVTLLERTTRSQNITEAGKNYLEHCRRIHLEVDLAEASIAQILNEVEGQLRIGVSVGMGHELLKPVLGRFMCEYPKVNLELNLLNKRVDLIEEGFDLVIRIGTLADSRLFAKNLGQVARKLYVAPSYLEQCGAITSIEQLEKYDFLLMSDLYKNGSVTLNSGKQLKSFQITPKILVNDFLVLKQMTIEGLGVAIIPDYMCDQELIDGSLVPLFKEWGMPNVDVYALYPKHRLNIPKVKAFLQYIQKVFDERL